MNVEYLIKGLLLGLTVSAPLGPLGILLIQRTMNKGFSSGLITGFGASIADLFYAMVAGLGFAFVANFIDANQFIIRIVGSVLLFSFGLKIVLSNPQRQAKLQSRQKKSLIADFLSSFFLTITNPATVIVFGGAFTLVGVGNSTIYYVLVGIFAGALLWWVLLAGLVNKYKHKIKFSKLQWINKISGSVVIIFGLTVFISLFLFP